MPPCERCRTLHELRNTAPPCKDCLPELMPENEDAVKVWQVVHGQVITLGPDNMPYDINIPAVKIVMDLYNVRNQAQCLEKIRAIFFAMLEKKEK